MSSDDLGAPSNSGSMYDHLIREHGWAVQAVFGAPGDPGPSGWAYTIGLEDRGRPELLIVGLPSSTAQGLLNRVIHDAIEAVREWPAVGETITGLARGGYGLRVVAVDVDVATAGEWFLGALARRGNDRGFRPLQLVWQEADFSWPDRRSTRQPVLGERWW